MSRSRLTPHQALPSYTTADALFLLRMDEAAGANNLTDALANRTMTQTGSPGAATSSFEDANALSSFGSGRGARTFDGATQYGGRTHDPDQTIFAAAAWGWEGWFTPTTLAATMTFLEFGEFGGTDATGPLMRCRMTTTGALRMDWRDSGGSARNNQTADGVIVAGTTVHLGIKARPSKTVHLAQDLFFYVNGVCVLIMPGRPLPASGTSARWIVGASRAGGSGVGSPGEFYNGNIDDLIFVPFTPEHEWFAEAYMRGVCQFFEPTNTTTDGEDATFHYAMPFEVHTRVLVEVSGNDGAAWTQAGVTVPLVNQTDIDLTDVMGDGFIDLLKTVSFKDSSDDTGPSASLEFVTRYDFFNLSPQANLSPVAGIFSQRRRLKVYQAKVPCGFCRFGAAPYFRLMFDGWAYNPDVDPDRAAINAVGPQSPLLQAWIEPAPMPTSNEQATGDRIYGTARGGGGRALELCIGDIISDHDPSVFTIIPKTGAESAPNGIEGSGPGGNIQIRVFGQADEHGKGRPHPFANADSVLVSGTTNFNGVYTANANTTTSIVEVSTTSVAAAEQSGFVQLTPQHSYRGPYPSVWVPTSPGFNMFSISEPSTKAVLTAIAAWCDDIGWVFRPRWDDTRKCWRMKLYDPRVSGSAIALNTNWMYKPGSTVLKHDFQRTAGLVEYADNSTTDNKGENVRLAVGFGDLARNGDRYYFRVVEDSKSLLTNPTDAQKELDGLKKDLGTDPSQNADALLNLPCDLNWDIGDHASFQGEETDSNQMPMVFGTSATHSYVLSYQTDVQSGRCRTTLQMMKWGNPSTTQPAGRQDWHHGYRLGPIGRQPGFGLRSPNAPAAPTVTNVAAIGPTRWTFIQWAFPVGDQNRAFDLMEVHYSTTNDFVPSPSTLQEVVRGTNCFLKGFTQGVTYHVKIVATDGKGNRSAPSSQTNFTS